jgi:hypothetical protein
MGMFVEMDIGEGIPEDFLEALGDDVVAAVVARIANSAFVYWQSLAQRELFSSRNDYVESIQIPDHSPGQSVISLVGQPANIIENGAGRVDLRDWLLGPNVPVAEPGQKGKHQGIGADGRMVEYRAVPFRHSVPSAVGLTGQPMGSPYKAVVEDSMQLGQDVYKKAQRLKGSEVVSGPLGSGEGRRTVWGGRLKSGIASRPFT